MDPSKGDVEIMDAGSCEGRRGGERRGTGQGRGRGDETRLQGGDVGRDTRNTDRQEQLRRRNSEMGPAEDETDGRCYRFQAKERIGTLWDGAR